MTNLRLQLQGIPKGISLNAFVVAVSNWSKTLTDIDIALSGISDGSVDWVVSDLALGSLTVEAEGYSKLDEKDYGPEIVHASIAGLRTLETDGLMPPYLTKRGLESTRRLLRLIGKQGVQGLLIANHNESVQVTARATANIGQLLQVRRHAIGSVEGRLEQISIHGKDTCVVYLHRTHKAVTCLFDNTLLDEVKNALGKRVIIAGIVSYNSRHEPIRLKAQRLRIMRTDAALPPLDTIGGSDPDFTGGVESVEYIRSMRDE